MKIIIIHKSREVFNKMPLLIKSHNINLTFNILIFIVLMFFTFAQALNLLGFYNSA